jgi:hypothetical protein
MPVMSAFFIGQVSSVQGFSFKRRGVYRKAAEVAKGRGGGRVICYLLLGKRKKWRFRLKESALRAASPYRVRDKNADENGLL